MEQTSVITAPAATATRKTARRLLALFAVLAIVTGTLVVADKALALDVGEWIATNIIGPIIELLVDFVGEILLLMVGVLISIAKYNDFVGSTAVANGWVIVRDVTNMFFILVLLVLAFGTMLGIESYSYKNRMLPRLLIMAVVINFSRTICGLLIDFGQVVMLTFVNGFAAAAGGNFVEALKIRDLMEPGEKRDSITGWSLVIALLFALAIVTISLGVVIIMTATLVIRIIYLWLLVILSPIAFFMKAVPGGKASGYYAEWWSMFTSNIITGPILAFFLWLSLVSVASGGVTKNFPSPTGGESRKDSISKALEGNNIQAYIISIGMLLGGVMMAQKAGGAGVGIGKSIATGAGKAVARGAKRVGAAAGGAVWDRTGAKAKDYALSKATALPGVGRYAGAALVKSRQARAAKGEEAAKFVSQLRPEEAARFAKSRIPLALQSTEQKAIRKEALRAGIKGAADKGLSVSPDEEKKGITMDMKRAEFMANKRTLRDLGKDSNDKSVANDLMTLDKEHPELIIDRDEKDPVLREAQNASLARNARRKTGQQIGEMNRGSLTDEFLMSADAQAILKASKDGTGEAKAALSKFTGISEAEMAETSPTDKDAMKKLAERIAQKQGDVKMSNFDMVDKEDRVKLVNGMSADKIAGMDFSKLSKEIGGELRKAMMDKGATPSQMAATGADFKEIFPSFNAMAGSLGGADKQKFESWMKADPAKAMATVPPGAMVAKGGTNDVAMAMMSQAPEAIMANIEAMAKSGKDGAEKAFAALAAASTLADMDDASIDKAAGSYQRSLPKDMPMVEANAAVEEFKKNMKQAANNALKVSNTLSDESSSLHAETNKMSFKGAKRAASQAKYESKQLAKVAKIEAKAAEAAKTPQQRFDEQNDRSNAETVAREARRMEKEALSEAKSRESKAKRTLSRIKKG